MYPERRHTVELAAAIIALWRKAQQDATFRPPSKFKLKHKTAALKLATCGLVKTYGVFHVPLANILPTRCNSASAWIL